MQNTVVERDFLKIEGDGTLEALRQCQGKEVRNMVFHGINCNILKIFHIIINKGLNGLMYVCVRECGEYNQPACRMSTV